MSIYRKIELSALATKTSATISFPRGIQKILGAHVNPKTNSPVIRGVFGDGDGNKQCVFTVVTAGGTIPDQTSPICEIISTSGAINLLCSNCIVNI